jgi:hypothetical protein
LECVGYLDPGYSDPRSFDLDQSLPRPRTCINFERGATCHFPQISRSLSYAPKLGLTASGGLRAPLHTLSQASATEALTFTGLGRANAKLARAVLGTEAILRLCASKHE